MKSWFITGKNVDDARESIFQELRSYKRCKSVYFDGWNGFGGAAVLRSIEQALSSIKEKKTPLELCYDIIVYIDCSAWESKRVMQKKIAEELELDHETMAMFDKHDEEDDFNCVDHGSRDVISSVSEKIDQTLVGSKWIILFINGSGDEVDITRFGVHLDEYRNNRMIWTFKRRILTMHDKGAEDVIKGKLRHTHLFLNTFDSIYNLTSSELSALLHEEAATVVACNPCMQDIDLTTVLECCLYCLFTYYCFHATTRSSWSVQALNCWLCDETKGKITREIRNALHLQINWKCNAFLLEIVFKNLMKDPKSPFWIVRDDNICQRRPYHWVWIPITTSLKSWEDMQTIHATASSCFLTFDNPIGQQPLHSRLFEECTSLQVLILSGCTFNFVSPPFLKCHKLRFLGLDHCTSNKTTNVEESSEWAFLHKLCVLDIRYTHWDEIITEEKIDLMDNLLELNIEGFCCWQYMCKLEGRLSNLQRLRIIKPTQQAETSVDSSNSFIDKINLEILDLSGNMDMNTLPKSLSKASSLQVLILDGCNGLENVVLSNGSLRFFSLDGYGPASCWRSTVDLPLESSRPKCAPNADNNDTVKTKKISLEGCTQLECLFVRGLPNLEEVDLSGSAIKVLEFKTMVVDIQKLHRLFLLGCEHLRAIIWGSLGFSRLDLVCMDTRPYKAPTEFTRPSLSQHKSFGLQLHAILADARLGRSLFNLLELRKTYFNIHITSSTELEATKEEMDVLINQRHCAPTQPYDDVFTEISWDALLMAFPEPPTQQLNRHIEISDGSLGLESELEVYASVDNFSDVMRLYAESLHLHDAMTSSSMPRGYWHCLKWCHVVRCPNLDSIFPPGARDFRNQLETIWASDLLMARNVWSKGGPYFEKLSRSASPISIVLLRAQGDNSFGNLQHLYLRSCPRLQFVLPVWVSSFPNLKSIHIIHCSDLRHVFELDDSGRLFLLNVPIQGVQFPKLTSIHLHDLPSLRRICDLKMLVPALDTISIRGCFGLRRLPVLEGREPGVKRPAVEIEKDVWDALEWEGLAAGHHPDLYESPVHSRHYRRRRLLKGTVLR